MDVSVCVDEGRLENLLSEEEKDNVTRLTITGAIREDDYAFIRSNRLKKISELNLRNADVDTLPAHAFDFEQYTYYKPNKIVLPSKLKHVSDYGLCCEECVLVLTGQYPTFGNNVFYHFYKDDAVSSYVNIKIQPSEDNSLFKVIDDCLYSSDGEILYYYANTVLSDNIQEGVRVIYGNAFENHDLWIFNGVIPESIDSIGDRAFAGFWVRNVPVGDTNLNIVRSYAMTPPKLGKDVFLNSPFLNEVTLYVPDESVELYKNAEGWNKIHKILPMSGYNNPQGIESLRVDNSLRVENNGAGYYLKSSKVISRVDCYDGKGHLSDSRVVKTCSVAIPKSTVVSPYTIVCVKYDDGTKQTIKLNTRM